jgi:hypothetical protein
LLKTDADGNVEWNKTFWGGTPSETIYGYDNVDGITGIVQTQNGDFILTMGLASESEKGQFLIKIDSEGTLVWKSPKLPDSISVSVQTTDGGFALAGSTEEDGNDLDILLVKTDSNGVVDWRQTLDYSEGEYTHSLVSTADGGFALSGYYHSAEPGASNFWFLTKTDSNGVMTWWQTYHKSSWMNSITLVQTTDGGYALAGLNAQDSYPGFMSLVKTDSNGDIAWTQTYSGLPRDYYPDLFLVQTVDRGFALAGTMNGEVYLVKIAENGTKEWKRFLGGPTDEDWATDLIQTNDGGFVFTGYMDSKVGLVKTNGNGEVIWNHTYEESKNDMVKVVIQTGDGGFVIAGATSSHNTGGLDAWLIKTDEKGVIEWNRTYGGLEDDGAEAIIQTADEGFALAGFTRSYGAGGSDAWLIKMDKNGVIEWNQSYGEELDDKALHLYQLPNGSFAMLGYFGQYLADPGCEYGCSHEDIYDDAWLLITDETGLFPQEFKYNFPGKVRFHDLTWSENSIRVIGTSFWQKYPNQSEADGIVGQDALFVLRMNQTGLYQWNKTLPSLSWIITPEAYVRGSEFRWEGGAVPIFTTDGGFILNGQFDGEDHQYKSLIKMDANGVTHWTENFTMNIIGDSMIIQTADGGYALAGGVFTDGPTGDSADAWLARIHVNGTMLWEQTYGTWGGQPHHLLEGQPYTAPTSFSSWFLVVTMLIVVAGIRSDKRGLKPKN